MKDATQPPLPLPTALEVLKARAQVKVGKPMPWEEVAETTHHSRTTVFAVWKWFVALPWEGAQALVEQDEQILRLRPDYLERMSAKKEEREPAVDEVRLKEHYGGAPLWDKAKELLIGQGLLDLAAEFKVELSSVTAKDYAVWLLPGAQWLSSEEDRPEEFRSVLDVHSYRGKLAVNLQVERDKRRFPLLMEVLASSFPELAKFEEWKSLLAEFLGGCQELCGEIWHEAEIRTGLKMGADWGYGYLAQVPLFIYEFALDNYLRAASPELGLSPVDLVAFPSLPPHYWQLSPLGRPAFILAVGLPQLMNSCGLITVELCQRYVQDSRIGQIIKKEKAVQEQAALYCKALSRFVASSTG